MGKEERGIGLDGMMPLPTTMFSRCDLVTRQVEELVGVSVEREWRGHPGYSC
jgi:hypothetical protein